MLGLSILLAFTLFACRQTMDAMATRILSFDDPGFEASREFEPFPDAQFRLFLEAASAQAFLSELPISAAEQVRQRVAPMDEHDAVVIVFLGTTPSDRYRARIVEVRTAPGNVEVVIATHAPERLEETVVYGYPVDARRLPRSVLPEPPFAVVYRSVSGKEWFRQTGVRPMIAARDVQREDELGDTVFVSREIRREYQEGQSFGRVIVREHATVSFAVYRVPTDQTHIQLYTTLPPWLIHHRRHTAPTCLLTDRAPEELVAAFPGDPWSVVTFRGTAVRLGSWPPPKPLALNRTAVPDSAWLACVSAGRSEAAPDDWLGTVVVDLYPVQLVEREPYTIEVVEVKPFLSDVLVRIRLHPPPSDAVPLELLALDPPLVETSSGEQRLLAAYLYYGFDREPSQLDYAISLHSDEAGQFFTWLLAPETNEFTLFLRLTTCTARGSPPRNLSTWNPPAGIECGTITAVEAFYTHRDFLRTFGLGEEPIEFRFAIRSPVGWRSEPFTVRLP
jgi:hypothetical protein